MPWAGMEQLLKRLSAILVYDLGYFGETGDMFVIA